MINTFEQAEPEESQEEVERCLTAAATAAALWGQWSPRQRADALSAIADSLDAEGASLIAEAMRETGLAEGRLTGELKRTTVQLRMFADVLRDGSYLRVVLDRQDPDFVLGPRPDLRRGLMPIGPVLVYAASNFPFAFSVAGGDTASALAAGCPVVLKAHPGHPRTSRKTADVVRSALAATGAPEGTFAMIAGRQAGVRALQDPRVAAGAFTGSVSGGRALFDIAASRPAPIPFYGELGSINPAVVTAGAERERADQVASGFVGSFTLGAGQFCTKPGILLLPRGTGLPSQIAKLTGEVPPARLLTSGIAERYRERTEELAAVPGVEVLARGAEHEDPSGVPAFTPTLFHAGSVENLREHPVLLEENFGPSAVIAEYGSDGELHAVLAAVEGSLTVTVHTADEPDDAERHRVTGLVTLAARRSGRIVFNDWPTGVAVTAAQQHGGPYPSTTAVSHTSVGTAAIDRFLRPVAYQNAPDFALPPALRESNPLGLPRTVGEAGDSRRWSAPQG
ncbi:aldehyde dehydrogenase (NADP(+)) [Saccharopolyspora erythraea]|uniref:aldehyde dehydrogenase (NADP(+)) n=1 Tax=Saccharopolyspora erythraea TaxID=1836 RepID=UPI001BABD8E4|nr:aldehyde dehydrogenase (NADP(+)) [Saccharopolyspora erythraea]QUH02082.1 aldehyde dehydrogenase (NADP(+)) [Saccharopolyspora erythraea]